MYFQQQAGRERRILVYITLKVKAVGPSRARKFVVGIGTGYGRDELGSIPSADNRYLFLSLRSDQPRDPHSLL